MAFGKLPSFLLYVKTKELQNLNHTQKKLLVVTQDYRNYFNCLTEQRM